MSSIPFRSTLNSQDNVGLSGVIAGSKLSTSGERSELQLFPLPVLQLLSHVSSPNGELVCRL